MTASEILLFLGGGAFLSFVGSIVTLIVNRRESKARIINLDASTNKLLADANASFAEIQVQLQSQISSLIKQAKSRDELYEKERLRWRDGYQRMQNNIDELRADLRLEKERNVRLDVELTQARLDYKRAVENYVAKIGDLETQLAKHSDDIIEIKQKTGKLFLPARDGRESRNLMDKDPKK